MNPECPELFILARNSRHEAMPKHLMLVLCWWLAGCGGPGSAPVRLPLAVSCAPVHLILRAGALALEASCTLLPLKVPIHLLP